MPRSAGWILAAAAVIIGVLGWSLWQARSELAALRAAAAKAGAPQPATLAPPRAPVEPRSAVVTAPAPAVPRVFTEAERQMRARMLQYQRWTRLGAKSSLLTGLNLPPEKFAPFKDLLVERDFAETDARDAAEKAGLDPHSSAATEAVANATEKVDQRIKALLGETDFARYADLVGLELFRAGPPASLWPGYFLDAGAPLDRAQERALADACYRVTLQQAQAAALAPGEPDPATGLQPAQTAILARAAPALSAAQVELLRNFFRSDNELGAWMKAASAGTAPK